MSLFWWRLLSVFENVFWRIKPEIVEESKLCCTITEQSKVTAAINETSVVAYTE